MKSFTDKAFGVRGLFPAGSQLLIEKETKASRQTSLGAFLCPPLMEFRKVLIIEK